MPDHDPTDHAATDDDPTDDDPTDGVTGDPLGPGVEQFQRAALDAVRAARAMLDAAEKVIADPAAVESMVRTAAGVARAATETVAGFAAGTAGHRPGANRRDDAGHAGGDGSDDDPDDGGYESIPLR